MQLSINGKTVEVDATPDMPVLWMLRDLLNLTGTKYGCGMALCGACTVHLDGQPVRSCVVPVSAAQGKAIKTIESLGANGRLHALQQAWIDEQVPQCGFCQPGMMMSATGALKNGHSGAEVAKEIGNICVCGTYGRIRSACNQL
jgi:isoquinoline 1-oxidoreductase alpha subunit